MMHYGANNVHIKFSCRERQIFIFFIIPSLWKSLFFYYNFIYIFKIHFTENMNYYYQRLSNDIFYCKAFYDLNFILNIQGQMTEKYYIISGKKKNKCVSLIMTNHQIVSDVFVLIMIKFGFNPGNHLVIGQESQPSPSV